MSFSNITNIYELLDQDGEEGVARLPVKKEVAAPKAAAPATKTTTPAVKSAQQSSYNKTQSPRGERRQGDGQRRDNRPPRQDNRPPRQQGGDQQGETERQPVESARRDRPADRQQAREKGESRGDNYRRNAPAGGFDGNKRVFDRKSATGRGDGQGRENKRGGRGKGGWGAQDGSDVVNESIKEIAKEGENIVQGEGVADNKGTDATAEKLEDQTPKEETEDEKKKREEREKEEKQVSWTDYQKQLADKKSQSTLLQAAAAATQRKANEGIDENTAKKWSSYEQVKRDDTPKEDEKKVETKTTKKQTVRLDELFNIKETPKPQYTERDDRKGGKKNYDNKKGGQGRKQGGQGQQSSTGAEVTFDATSFPTLQ